MMKSWIDKTIISPMKRRSFMKWGSVIGGTAAITSAGLPLKALASKEEAEATKSQNTKTTWSACMVNCGSRCGPAGSYH